MKKRIYSILIVKFILFFYQSQLSAQGGEFQGISYPYLVDTSQWRVAYREETWLATASYNYLYIGPYKDTVLVNYELAYLDYYAGKEHNSIEGYYFAWFGHVYKHSTQSMIEIYVDTSTIISNYDIHVNEDAPYFKSYPVWLRNLEMDTVIIGYGDFLPLIMEAQDSLKKWQPIEGAFEYFCMNGIGEMLLPPKELVLTSAMIYNGNYKTRLRLKMGNNYSTPFEGTINYRQLESKFDEMGNYRKEYLEENKK